MHFTAGSSGLSARWIGLAFQAGTAAGRGLHDYHVGKPDQLPFPFRAPRLSALRAASNPATPDLPDEARDLAAEASDSGRPLVVYCAAGVRSAQALEILAASGIGGVDLPGGINAWLERQ